MKVLVILFAMILSGSAVAGEYSLENRPDVVFKGGIAHKTPYPQSRRSTSIWVSDACWRDCSASCTWKMEACVRGGGDADQDGRDHQGRL